VGADGSDLVAAVRAICTSLPEVTERLSHGTPSFCVRAATSFATVWPDGHHGEAFAQLWCAAPEGVQALLVADDPGRYFRPPYVGGRGWVGIRLDGAVDWDDVRDVCEDAYRAVAPAALVAELDAG
jgi:hypothetical protein